MKNIAQVAGSITRDIAAERGQSAGGGLVANWPQVAGEKTRDIAAERAGFGHRRAKRTDLELPANWPEVAGKETRDRAAERAKQVAKMTT